jgi:hypothetical protein
MRLYCDVLGPDLVSLTPLRSLMTCRGGYREHHPLHYPRHCGVHWSRCWGIVCLQLRCRHLLSRPIPALSEHSKRLLILLILYIPMRFEDNGLHINKYLYFGSVYPGLPYKNGTSNSQLYPVKPGQYNVGTPQF